MTTRRTLIDGLSETPDLEELENRFVFGEKATEVKEDSATVKPSMPSEVLPQFRSRVPLTTRCSPELASALKRVSLERQLSGIEPYRMQEILEQALEDWLVAQGYRS